MATNLVVDSKLSQGVDAFINEVDDDFKAPHQSTFQDYMPKVKRDVQSMEEVSQHNGTSIKYALIFLQFKILINKYYKQQIISLLAVEFFKKPKYSSL